MIVLYIHSLFLSLLYGYFLKCFFFKRKRNEYEITTLQATGIYYILHIQLIAGPRTACLYDNVEPPRDVCAPTTQRWSSMMDKVHQQRYIMLHLFMESKYISLFLFCNYNYYLIECSFLYLYNLLTDCLLFSKGTHHLWSVPVLSFQDVTYHFRVSLSVSKLFTLRIIVSKVSGWNGLIIFFIS